jgi:hypothetical protein
MSFTDRGKAGREINTDKIYFRNLTYISEEVPSSYEV